jgi:hypothetical protein
MRYAGARAGAILFSIVVLRINIGKAGLNRVELVATNPALKYFLPSSGSVEPPHSVFTDEGESATENPPAQR